MELVWTYLVIQISLWKSLKNIQINHGIGIGFSRNPNITMEYRSKNIQINHGIGMDFLSNPNITMEIVEKYPDKPWDWIGLSYNPNITMEIVEKYPDKPWNWIGVSRNLFELNST